VVDSGVSHRYSAMGDQTLCVLFLIGVNIDSHTHYIDINDSAHCPLIKRITPGKDMGGGLMPSKVRINSNTPRLILSC
jgi:hypothetical protein